MTQHNHILTVDHHNAAAWPVVSHNSWPGLAAGSGWAAWSTAGSATGYWDNTHADEREVYY